MAKITRSFAPVMISLLAGLILILGSLFTPLRYVRANPGELYAAPTAQGSGDCSSWDNACTLQTALASASDGDEIWVRAGVHYPGAAGQLEATFALLNHVALYGGFAGIETERDQRDWMTNVTILSGDIDQNDINDDGNNIAETWEDIQGSNAYHVVSGGGTDSSAVLDGFTITAGKASGSLGNVRRGGGIYNFSSSPTLVNVTISGNFAADAGGGMSNLEYSSPNLTNVTFNGNGGGDGGGMYNSNNSNPILTNATFNGNVGYYGGGMYNSNNSNPILTNITFEGNIGDRGGGMYNSESSPALTHVTFSGNDCFYGGGMYNWYSSPTLNHVTFSGNSVSEGGGGMVNQYSSPTLTGVTFNGNTAYHGGGMVNYTSNPTLTSVTFSGNSAEDVGGGMVNSRSHPTLTDVTFTENSSGRFGGGMVNVFESDPTLVEVIFSANYAGEYGGGILNTDQCSPILTNVTFSGNSSGVYGGGIYNHYESHLTMTNVILYGNSAIKDGGGMVNGEGSNPTLTNVTFSGNSANENGGGLYNYGNSNPTLTNVILWGNNAPNGAGIYNDTSTPQIAYSDVQGCGNSGGWNSDCGTDGGGNIDADPLFVDTPIGDFRLLFISPAVDAGNNKALPPEIVTDLDGKPRFVDIPIVPDTGNGTPPIVDMGAYEAEAMDVALGKSVMPQSAAPGDIITFTLTLTNAGSLPATGIVITDSLPVFLGNLSFTSTLSLTDTGHLPVYVWLVQDLIPGEGGIINVSGVLTAPLPAGIYTNTAIVSAEGDQLAEDNMAIITFTVSNVTPYFTSSPVITVTQDEPYTYTTLAQDRNGDLLTITAPALPHWLMLEDQGDGTATLSGTPTSAEVGDHAVVLQVTDSGGLSGTQAYIITVLNANDPPFFTSAPIITAMQEVLYTYTVTVDDPDLIHGDALTITAPTLPGWLMLEDQGDGTATLSGTPTIPGDSPVLLRVTDHFGAFAEQSFTITVLEKSHYLIFLPPVLNRAP